MLWPTRHIRGPHGNYLFTFNPVFTRIVNHCVTVLGTNIEARLPGR